MRDVRAREESVEDETHDPVSVPDHLEERVDTVIADHRVVLAELESRARVAARSAGFTQPVGTRSRSKVARRAWRDDEVHLDEAVLRDRTERARLLRELEPSVVRPHVDPPVVTRLGVFHVAPEFTQVDGLDEWMDADLLRSGIRSAEAFLSASDRRISDITGLSLADVTRAKNDLDLARLPGVRRDAADLLRLVGVHSMSALARADPVALAARLAECRARHRILDFPAVLASPEAVERLVSDAKGHA